MPDFCFLKICLFGWLSHSRPFCGPRKRWRDLAKSDLKNVEISDGYWYRQAQEREKWRSICSHSVELLNQPVKDVVCHGASEENVIKYVINVLWRGLNQSRSTLVLCSVNSVIDGSGVGEVWQYTDVGRMSQR